MLIRFKAGPRNRSFPGPGLHKHQDSHRCACGFGCGNIPSFSCSGTFTIQSSATNHPVLRVPIVRRCPDNHARQSHISDSTLFSPRQVTNLAEPYPQQLQHHRVQGKLMQPTQSLFTQSDRIFPVSEVLKKARVKSHLSPPSPKTNGVKN